MAVIENEQPTGLTDDELTDQWRGLLRVALAGVERINKEAAAAREPRPWKQYWQDRPGAA
jgi:hypothetical protein